MSTSIPSSAMTGGQRTKYLRMIEDAAKRAANLALKKVDPDKEGMQRLLGFGDDLESSIAELVIAKTRELSTSNQFADEQVASKFGYLSGYKKPKGMTEQTNMLRRLFPGIGFADEKLALQPLPKDAEGYFAIPRWQSIASTYGEAVEKVFAVISETHNGKFYNYREGELGPDQLRQSDRTARMFAKLGEAQTGYDILVVPAQFGLLHRGRSVRRVREIMRANEFGLGAFAIGIMILTHPERLQHYDDLWIDCAGDEFSPDADGRFDYAPFFSFFDGGEVEFVTLPVSDASEYYGSVSGFLPQ